MASAFLQVNDHLRCMAASGSWTVFSSVAKETGVVGRVYRTGEPVALTDPATDPAYMSLGPQAALEVCVPIRYPDGHPMGVLNVEWTEPRGDPDRWLTELAEVGHCLGTRVVELGGPPTESETERLLRHALAMTTAQGRTQLVRQSLVAAREVSGLSTPVLLMPGQIFALPDKDGTLAARVSALDPDELTEVANRARRHGATYSLGDPAELDGHGFELLTDVGVRSMIIVPVGPGLDASSGSPSLGAVLLLVDEQVCLPESGTVNLIELLAAQAWSNFDRLGTLRKLRERAISDPLTGLLHQAPFDERLAAATPGHTAVLAIDIDRFKDINDTYGHQAGDRALVDLARALQGALRGRDELYRIGGDEFAAVVEVARPEEAAGIADRLISAARRIGRSVSIGVAVRAERESAKETLRRADAALYDAKRHGRDGVRLAPAWADDAQIA